MATMPAVRGTFIGKATSIRMRASTRDRLASFRTMTHAKPPGR
jgi:hypothetical protein